MEHSALHALLLTGLILALGGPVAVLWLLVPSARGCGIEAESKSILRALLRSAARWTTCGALAAAFATFVDFFVQVAELQGGTVFGGVDFSLVIRFASRTTVGQLCLARIGLLLLAACATRLRGLRGWRVTAVLAFGAVILSSLVSHAAAQPSHRFVAILSQVAHITVAGIWMGVLLHLVIARSQWLAGADISRIAFISGVVKRFSPIALAATSLIGITGSLAAWRYLHDTGALFTSAYGLTLIVKLVLIAPAICAGFVNFRFIRPRLAEIAAGKNSPPGPGGVLPWFSRMLELEVTAGLLVITVAGILGSLSPPGDDAAQRLTAAQTHAFLSPHLPNTDIRDWDKQDDPRGVTLAAMRYSEFTHNWSGVMVCLMGLAWLAQSAGGRIGVWAGRLSPFLLLPFGVFIALAADPELWVLRQYSPWEALTNPQLLEHQIGAALVFVLAWLAWRDLKNPEDRRPFGYALPVIMISGSLLLLGHAHSTLTITDELINLINVQHAVFGAFGLFGGTLRLLVLRGLLRAPFARFAWSGCVIGLGMFMAFFYRELV